MSGHRAHPNVQFLKVKLLSLAVKNGYILWTVEGYNHHENKRIFYPCMNEKNVAILQLLRAKKCFVTGYNYGLTCEGFDSLSRKF